MSATIEPKVTEDARVPDALVFARFPEDRVATLAVVRLWEWRPGRLARRLPDDPEEREAAVASGACVPRTMVVRAMHVEPPRESIPSPEEFARAAELVEREGFSPAIVDLLRAASRIR